MCPIIFILLLIPMFRTPTRPPLHETVTPQTPSIPLDEAFYGFGGTIDEYNYMVCSLIKAENNTSVGFRSTHSFKTSLSGTSEDNVITVELLSDTLDGYGSIDVNELYDDMMSVCGRKTYVFTRHHHLKSAGMKMVYEYTIVEVSTFSEKRFFGLFDSKKRTLAINEAQLTVADPEQFAKAILEYAR